MDQEVEDLLENEVNKIYGRCRCCLDYGYVKDIWTEYLWEGVHEIYGEMLMETFSIAWESIPNEKEQICDMCVSRLRDANMFKREVLASEQLLREEAETDSESVKAERLSDLDQYENTTEDVIEDPEMKEEVEYEEVQYEEEFVADEVEYEEVEFLEEEIVTETAPEANVFDTPTGESSKQKSVSAHKPKRKRIPGLNTRNYKNYSEDTLRKSIEFALNSDRSISEVAAMYGVPRKTLTARVYNAKHQPKPDDPESSPDEQPSQKETQESRMKTVHKYRHNLKTILSWSNGTPFKTRGSDYVCCFCDKMCSSPKDLKEHTLTVHTDRSDDHKRIMRLSEFSVRLDVTDLKCLICRKEINSLENLIAHLIKHGKDYHTDIKNQIVPYKFDTDQFKCTQCDKVFTFLILLSNHMSEHYPNYECDECGKVFVHRHRLASHKALHKKGQFKCTVCPKVFSTNVGRNTHQRKVHVCSGKIYKCWKCDLFFEDQDGKGLHDVESHGAEPQTYKCNICEQTFQNRKARIHHISAVHSKRKPHKCSVCDKDFAKKSKLDRHMVTHTGEKKLNCPICNRAFALADYLRVHMKTHDKKG